MKPFDWTEFDNSLKHNDLFELRRSLRRAGTQARNLNIQWLAETLKLFEREVDSQIHEIWKHTRQIRAKQV